MSVTELMTPARRKLYEAGCRAVLNFYQDTRLERQPGNVPRRLTPADRELALNSFKTYPSAPQITLPPPGDLNEQTLATVFRRRRSGLNFAGASRPLGLVEVGQLVYAAAGITQPGSETFSQPRRTAPSAGALYPLELYVAALHPLDFPAGLYHYAPHSHALEQLSAEHPGAAVQRTCTAFGSYAGQAGVVIFLTGVLERTLHKYGARGYRYILLEAGHVAQNLYLAATALDLTVSAISSFVETRVEGLLNLDGAAELPVYVLAAGHPA